LFIDEEYLTKLEGILTCVDLAGASDSVIAGGAIRDMLLEKEIADIDVFITGEVTEASLKPWFDKVEPCDNGMYEESTFNVMFKCSVAGIPVPIQIIQVKGSIAEHIKAFPCCLSRVIYTREYGLGNITYHFLWQAQKEQLFFDRKVNMQYVEKMTKKFPEFKVMYALPEYAPHYMSQTTSECLNF
jgi:hypothetical protein